MARTLPWLKDQPAKRRKVTASPQPAKRPRLEEQDDDGEAPLCPTSALPKDKLSGVKRRVRTPSTSPPPEAPTEESVPSFPLLLLNLSQLTGNRFIVPGLENDDIYIMVEDEFLATAQTFTAHLHHAEYIRLKNLTKSQNALTVSTIFRPVDGTTFMRDELKKRKQAEACSKKVMEGLAEIKDKRPRIDSDEEDEEAEAANDKDPWAGTAIEGLMKTSPAKNNISLTGIQGVKSTTRAAAGYKSPAKLTTTRGTTKAFNLNPHRTSARSPSPDSQKLDNLSDTTASDSDDLDAPVSKSKPLFSQTPLAKPKPTLYNSHLPSKHSITTSYKSPPPRRRLPFSASSSPSPSPPPPSKSLISTSRFSTSKLTSSKTTTKTKTTLKTRTKTKTNPFKSLGDDTCSPSRSLTDTAKRSKDLQARQAREKEAKRTSLSEIPIFIV
ncbi:MAG: hypothetical protein MMC33_001155 [Icmadophila ericetorum]|nr:hypothetical protein [Icmadophila ericetorum]